MGIGFLIGEAGEREREGGVGGGGGGGEEEVLIILHMDSTWRF